MKKILGRFWRLILAAVLIIIAILIYNLSYVPAQEQYVSDVTELSTSILTLETEIQTNLQYESVQDDIEEAEEDMTASRTALYNLFPTEMREEDQIMYMLYLEEVMGEDVVFSFSDSSSLYTLSDGAVLGGLLITVEYTTTYEGFKDLIDYLATDSQFTSIVNATMDYDSESDTAAGTLTILYYTLQSDLSDEYTEPDVETPDTGKDNIFE